jgi:hypothetical protein
MSIDASIERPASVRRAAACLWASAGLALALTAVQVLWVVGPADVGVTIGIGVATAGLLALFAAKINAGRGWARWLYALIYTVGTLGSAVLLLVAPGSLRAYPALVLVGTGAQFILQTTAMALIFTSASRWWFKVARAKTAP